MIDRYSLKARYAPALLTIVLPIMVFNHFFLSPEFADLVGNIFGAKIISNLSISIVSLYYLSEVGRFIGKHIFEKIYFKDEAYMPTTNFLMFSDKIYSSQYKAMFNQKVKIEFGLALPSHDEQLSNESDARRRIVEVMALIRKKLHKNKFLLQHNIEYGAMRNAIGGATIGFLLCLFNIIFFKVIIFSQLAIIVSTVLIVIYIVFLLLGKNIMSFYGNNYAKILFREYMGLNHQ